MKTKLEGLHLWSVELTATGTKLWITTKTNCPTKAIERANAYLRRNRDMYRRSVVSGLSNHGTIDA